MRDCLASSLAVAVVILCSIPRRLLGQDTLCRDHDFYLNFPQRQANQFSKVAVTGDKAIEAFTICAWLKTSDVYHIGLLRYSDSAIIDRISLSVLPDTGQLRFTLLDEERRTKPLPEVRNNNWHGLCVTWKSVDGIFMVYYGGRLFYTENSLKTGVRLSSNHTFTVGIGNQNDEIFSGRLGHVNVWTKVLEHPLLATLSYKCGVERGDWISWPQFMKGAYGIDVVVGETCPFDGDDLPPDQLQYLRLNGEDASNLINLHYSAAFLEGRLDGQGSLYLDGTQAFVATPKVDLHMAFTIACWVKLVPTNSDFRAILRNDQKSPGFVFGVDSNQQLQFNNTSGVGTHVYTASNLHEKVWQHVAVSFVTSVEVSLYINGLQFPQNSSYGFQWRRPAGNSFEVGRYLDPSNIYRYFHGYLSDLYVFGRALGAEDIGIIMGRSPSCTYKEWSSPPLLPGKAPTEKYGNFICPGIGQCKTVLPWRPADCREALLAVNRTSGVYMISPLNNDVEFQVFCDHDTHGGGWTVIQRRRSSSEKTNKTWAEYKTGFGKVNGKSEMWLGNDKIHALTTKDTELLIQLQGDDGSTGYAIYTDFRVSDEKDQYRLLLGTTAGFSGNIANSFFEHNNATFTTADLTIGGNCAIAEGGGWWFTNCGDALLNSVMIKWSGFGTGVAITMTEMKIRRKDGFSSDYILKFPSGSVSYLLWPNILTELKAFSVCLWLRFQPLLMGTKDRSMILFQYRSSNGNATIKYSLTWGTLKTTIWSSNVRTSESIQNELLDDRWHHVCSIWAQVQAKLIFCIDSSCQFFTGTMGSVPLAGGGQICIGAGHSANKNHFEGEITLMNMWDYVLQQTFIQTLANSGGAETGNVLHWSFFAAMAVGNVQCSQYSSIFPKELHRWTFDQSLKTKSFDVNKKHKASITGARIATERPSVVIDDEGYFLSELASSDVSTDKGFTVSFSMRHSALTSDILQDDFEKLELLRTAFPTFIRDNALWKQCYSANQTSWRTQVFHSNCDNKGPSLTIIKTGDYIFGGFVEQSWGGPPADIGNQHEGFLFSLANPSNKYPQFLPILPGKPSGRTDPLLGPSFGQHDLELYQDASGRLKGFSGLGASFDITNISLSPSAARNFFTGSQQFNPHKVEVFYYHVPSKAVGIESRVIGDSDISSSSVLNQHFADHARLNELGEFWCSNTTDASSWLQVFLGRQYTLTHIAIQGINEFDVRAMTVKYEKTRDGENWITYSKHLGGNVNAKVVLFKNLSQEEIGKEAFFPPFEAVKVRLEVGSGTRCMKIELYYFDAGCSQAYGVEDPNAIPDEKISTSSTRNPSNKYDWPFRGRLNHNEGTRSWGPYKHPIYRQADSWIQVDLEKEQEVTCIDTQGRPAHTQYTKKYQVSCSTNGHDWRFYENNNGDKTFNANSDDDMTVRNWLHPPVYGRFIRIHLTECHSYCRIRLELYGRRNMSNVFPFGHGLGFIIRHGRYHVVFVKQKSLWEIRLPLILNKWFEATLTWAANDGLKFYVSGNLTASDNIPTQFGVTDNNAESFTLMIGSTEDVGGWARSTCIDDVTVWSTAMSEDMIKRKSQVFLDFDDNSRNWALFLAGSNDWKLNRGCTLTEGTGPCDDVSGGGHYIYFGGSSPSARDYSHSARFTIPVRFSSSYACVKFHYYMSGLHVGRLNVYLKDHHGNERLLWRLFGHQNNTWSEALVPVDVLISQYQVIVEAKKGFGHLGDIAIDEITFSREKCSLYPLFASPNGSPSDGIVITSSTVRIDSVHHQYLSRMLKEAGHNSSWWRPCYHALHHGWDVSTFHRSCDNKAPTLTIVRKDNYVFGGFTEQSWRGSSENYQADGKAFIFSLNYTSQSYLFKKEIGEASSSSAIYSSPSTGPTFGEAPFDFQIGINGNMREGSSQHVISYRGGNDVTDSNLRTVLAGASNFTVSDVEVLYKEQGASLCDHQCPYNYFCDEINGGCRCKHERDFPRLCELYKHYNDCTHFWPLESVGNIEDVITHTWGVVKGGVHTAGGLLTDGVSGEVQLLDSEGNSCATKHITNMNCIDHGFTVALRLKYFNRADGQKQVLFKSFGKFVIYQESNDFLIFRIEVNNRFCVKEEVAVAEKIWSHIVFTFSSVHPKTLTVYRNGEKLNEFLRSEPCSSPGQRQYLSPSVSLGAGLGVFAKAFFDDVAIWDHVLTDERIAELSKANTDFFPFKVGVVVRITNQSWHEDLYLPGTARYSAITSNIINNVTMFYSNYSEVRVSVVMNEYRPGSVKANFTIEYNVNNFSLIEELNKTIFYSGRLYDLPVELIEMTTYFVPSQAPPNFRASQVSDTSIDLAWQHPELSSTMWEIFQGYKIFVRPAGSSGVHSITINAQKTVARLQGLKSLVTYDISIAAYTFAGVGKESEIICITTTLDAPPANVTVANVTTSCVRIKWDQVPPEQIGGMFQGYKVMMIMVGQQSSSSDEFVTNNATNEADICNLLSLTTFEFYVTRFFLNKTGNRSDVQNFTTLEQAPLYPPKNVKCHNRSSTALVVQWQQPPINGMERSFIRGYKVLYHTRNIIPRLWGTQIVCNCTFNTTVVKLEKYSEYNILVAAFNRAGLGNFSDVVRCFTDEDIPLSGPANITALNSSSTSVELHWSPVPKPLRLGLITHYTFNVTEVSTGRLRVVIFDSATLSGMVRNLSKYTEYSIVGAAANSKGQSNFTVAVTCRTNEDAPDLSPLNVTAFNTSSTSIMVEFQAPSPEKLNGIIRKFRFTFFKAGERNATVRRVTADRQHSRRRRESLALTDNTFKSELRNLEEYTMFSIQVAFITVKEGPYSKIFNASTDEGVPRTPPLQVAAFNSSSTSIMIVWQNLTSTSVPGILLGYKLRYIKADDNNATEVIDLTHGLKTYKNITNLEVFTLYNISVAGYTRMGVGNASVTQSWTDEGVPAGPPNKITVDSVTSTTIALSWLPVAKGLQNGIIRGYQLYLYRASEYATYTTLLVPSRSAVFGGLTILSNYSIQIRAFTRKGYGVWSGLVNTSTGAGAPDQIPMNSTAQAAGPMTIHVTWSPVVLAGARVLRGYRIKYFAVDKPHLTMDITVGSNGIYANLTGLRPFTVYNVQVAAFSSEEGNFTSPLLVKTWEGVPSAPPSRFRISVLDSQTFLVRWVQVPLKHQNGIIRGYRLTYWNAVNGTSSAITMKDYQRSYVLRPLRKATKYVVQLWAFTNAGDGTVGTYTALTDEDVPSKPPSKLAAQNYIGLTKIPISWEPVPQEFVHGYLAGYRVTYQAVYIGDLPADSEPVISEDIGPVNTSLTLQSLESLTVYRITVAARTNKGPGPEAVTFGKTCRCRPRLTTNWRNYPPYVNLTSRNDTGIIIPHLLVQVVDWCCGWCREHNRSKLDLNQDGHNQRAQRRTLLDLQQNIDNKTDFSFPVIGHKLQDSYKGGLGYAPFVESAGVAFVVYTDTSSIKQAMFAALLACWPVIVIPAIMGYIAGVLVWILDTHSNEQHFPRSFISGTWEGVWWAFVSMTTVGYGDRCPSSYFGRIFAVCWVLTGLVIISITTGALTTALTTIAKDSDPSIYGSKVGAIYGSPEYNLGVRKNAIVSRDKLYHSLEELSDALINREVDGILIDTYAGGNRKELFTKPFIRVARIIDYQTAYGVVIGGDSMRLRHCFHGYMRAHQAEIFSFVEELVKPITGSGVSNEEVVQDISTGLFDSGTNYFRNTLLLSSTFSITAVVIGLCYEVVRRIRGRRTVEQDKSLSVHKDKMIEEMSLTVADFVQHSTNTLSKMKAKYKKEILKRAKHSTRGLKRLKSPITSSLESNLTKEDDISVISLEDDDGNSKC